MLAIHQMRSGSSHITTRAWQQAGLAHPHWMASSKLVWLLDVWMDRIEVSSSCVITLNKGFSLRILYCAVDTGYGLGGSLGDCRSALPKGQKYQMVKTQTESHDWRPIV